MLNETRKTPKCCVQRNDVELLVLAHLGVEWTQQCEGNTTTHETTGHLTASHHLFHTHSWHQMQQKTADDTGQKSQHRQQGESQLSDQCVCMTV